MYFKQLDLIVTGSHSNRDGKGEAINEAKITEDKL